VAESQVWKSVDLGVPVRRLAFFGGKAVEVEIVVGHWSNDPQDEAEAVVVSVDGRVLFRVRGTGFDGNVLLEVPHG